MKIVLGMVCVKNQASVSAVRQRGKLRYKSSLAEVSPFLLQIGSNSRTGSILVRTTLLLATTEEMGSTSDPYLAGMRCIA